MQQNKRAEPKDEDQIVSNLDLTEHTTLSFSVWKHNGKIYGSIRTFVFTDNYEGPGLSGFAMEADKIDQLCEILNQRTEDILDPEPKEIATIPLRAGYFLRIGVNEYKGRTGVDIRVYFSNEIETGPTKRGIRISIEEIDQFMEKLEELNSALQKLVTPSDVTSEPLAIS